VNKRRRKEMEDIVRRRKEKEKKMKGAVMKWKGKKG